MFLWKERETKYVRDLENKSLVQNHFSLSCFWSICSECDCCPLLFVCDLSSKSHGKLSAPWWGNRNWANTRTRVRGVGNDRSFSLCKNLYTDRFTWIIIRFFCSPWICHYPKERHAWMFKEIKTKLMMNILCRWTVSGFVVLAFFRGGGGRGGIFQFQAWRWITETEAWTTH